MAQVTVCIPAYRSEAWIAQTLASVLAQSFADLHVVVALEPEAHEATLHACTPFLADRRITVRINPCTLGWDGNVAALLDAVESPFFLILPHDDLLHPDYIQTLHTALIARPAHVAAYADMFVFGESVACKRLSLAEDSAAERALSFFLQGAEAVPWRGLTRREALDSGGFPRRAQLGFAVECEWALRLLLRGPLHHVPRPLYFKRSFARGAGSVSRRWRSELDDAALADALEQHRAAMLHAVHASLAPEPPAPILLAAIEAAMLLRARGFLRVRGTMDGALAERAGRVEAMLRDAPRCDATARIASMLLSLRANLAPASMPDRREPLLRAAVALDPDRWQAHAALANVLLQAGRPLEAAECAQVAHAAAPNAPGLHALLRRCSDAIDIHDAQLPDDDGP